MKRLWICMLLFCFPWHAVAQSETADEQANCNASFLSGCPSGQDSTTSSDGFAAPLGALGNSGLESLLMALLIAGGIARRLHSYAADGEWKNNHGGPFEHPQFHGQSDAQQEPFAPDGPE